MEQMFAWISAAFEIQPDNEDRLKRRAEEYAGRVKCSTSSLEAFYHIVVKLSSDWERT